ncbi:polysaccharide deacetylase family protein [Paenibacillus sp. NPDC056722]|uniref:polysaccharide deacetylase family protein n=1 Tax=Paenibacillus sp. NPDC056722 TaxID=3345924 RepID=UPI0036C599BB
MKSSKVKLLTLTVISAVLLVFLYRMIFPIQYSFLVEGKESPPPKFQLSHGELFVPASFLENSLGLKIKWDPLPQESTPTGKGIYYRDKVLTLMYHAISPEVQKGASSISTAEFRTQLELLKKNNFHIITMDQYADFMLKGGKIPDNAVLLTFDDGYESFYTYAYPLLKEFGDTATNFVIVGAVDGHVPGLPKLTWDQMREMKKSGMSFYNHTYDAHHMITVNSEGDQKPALAHLQFLPKENRVETVQEYRNRIDADLRHADNRLQTELGNTRNILCFPYGKYSLTALEVAQSQGINLFFTIGKGINTKFDRIGYRLDASKAGETPEHLIARMKRGGKESENAETKGLLMVNDIPLPFSGSVPKMKDNELMIPLREFSAATKVNMTLSNRDRKVTLSMF